MEDGMWDARRTGDSKLDWDIVERHVHLRDVAALEEHGLYRGQG